MHDGAAASGHDARDGAPATARTLSYAEAIREALAQAMETDPRVFLFGEDVGVYGGAFGVSGDLFKRFGAERVVLQPVGPARERLFDDEPEQAARTGGTAEKVAAEHALELLAHGIWRHVHRERSGLYEPVPYERAGNGPYVPVRYRWILPAGLVDSAPSAVRGHSSFGRSR